MEITKESCKLYADETVKELGENVLKQMGYRYLHIEPIVRKMGGFANFRHYFCNQIYLKEIEKLQAQLEESQLANKGLITEIEELENRVKVQFCKLIDAKEQLDAAEKVIEYYSKKSHWGIINSLGKFQEVEADFAARVYLEKYKGGE